MGLPTISKVKSVQSAGTFKSQYGLMYKFDYEMEDGTLITANHKSETAHQAVGATVEYQIKQTNNYGNSGTVGKPKEVPPPANQPNQNFSNPNKSSEVQDMIIRQSSIKAAIDFKVASGSNANLSEVINNAEIIFEYCKTGKTWKQ